MASAAACLSVLTGNAQLDSVLPNRIDLVLVQKDNRAKMWSQQKLTGAHHSNTRPSYILSRIRNPNPEIFTSNRSATTHSTYDAASLRMVQPLTSETRVSRPSNRGSAGSNGLSMCFTVGWQRHRKTGHQQHSPHTHASFFGSTYIWVRREPSVEGYDQRKGGFPFSHVLKAR
jgi:hypothetical protein